MTAPPDRVAAFLEAACVPLDAAHVSGTLDEANAILAATPAVATHDIHTAAVLGDDEGVRRFLGVDPANATAKGGPRGWDPLTYLCFSRYLRLDPSRSDGFVRAAEALLEAGADPNTGWFETGHQPDPVRESALYGAAGVAHHAELTRLLLRYGADPNDDEVPYHAPEGWDNDVVRALLESGRLTDDSLGMMLIRKVDWHDPEGIRLLLDAGARPSAGTRWGFNALHKAVRNDSHVDSVRLMLERGADPTLVSEADGVSSVVLAARRGRGDLLALFAERGIPTELEGADRLIAACARGDAAGAIVEAQPERVAQVVAHGGWLLARFAGTGNAAGVGLLLDLGVPVSALFAEGDGYFGVAPRSTALHVAAWRAHHDVVKLLIDRGAAVDARDGAGRTPLMLAVRACVDSYWTDRRSPESVQALLAAGASTEGVAYPSGYAEVDALLAPRIRHDRATDATDPTGPTDPTG
jgi:ankyrin repeat protein